MSSNAALLADFKKWFETHRIRARCVCGGDRAIPVLRNDRYGIPIVPVFCRSCGHTYARFRMSEADTERFYSTIYRTLYSGLDTLKSDEAAKPRIRNSRKVIFPAFQSCLPEVARPVVVEWGCGAGWNLVPFNEAGVETHGFDFDADFIKFGSEHFGLHLHAIPPDLKDPGSLVSVKADFLILNHVLEHVPDPIELLNRLRSVLKPGGYIYIGLPFLENLPTWHFRGFFHIGHLHYFSLPYWNDLMECNGFEVVLADKKAGYVVVRLVAAVARHAQQPKHRVYNGFYLASYAAFYQFLYPAWRLFVGILKKIPGTEKSYSMAVRYWQNMHVQDE